MGSADSFPYDLDVGFGEAHGDQPLAAVALDDVVENSIGLGITDSEVAFIGLALDEVGGGGLVDDDFGDAEGAGDFPDLGLKEIAERVDGRRVVGVPGVVAKEALGFVSGSDGDSADFGGLIEEHDHARTCTHVPEALGGDSVFVLIDIAVDHAGDFDGPDLNPEVVDNELGVIKAFLAADFVGHSEGEGVIGSECAGAEVRNDCGIDSAGESEHDFVHASSLDDFGAEKLDEPFRDLLGVNA